MGGVRIDKWLWAVRLFKTRSIASEACKKGQVMINGMNVKSAREVKEGEIIEVKRPPIIRKYKVKQLAERRMGAKLVPEYMVEVTEQKELDLVELQKNMSWFKRDRGTGRPTKKERRDLDSLMDL
ncbi:RNA-binding S4 domain-containing protein [Puteibacter caeruleilacunae]|nr:RNA-binding S4 domain-containing protein [Puteibacter caeruleilacunae]